MQSQNAEFIRIIEEEYTRRKRTNSSYSLRAFARDIGIHSSTLSAVLKKKRALPNKKALAIADRIGLSPSKKQAFIDSIFFSKKTLADLVKWTLPDTEKVLSDENHFRIIAEWEHYALLTLLKVKNFKSDMSWMARRLGIDEIRVKDVLGRLIAAGLVEQSQGEYRPTFNRVETTDGNNSTALKKSHKEALEMASEKLDSIPSGKHSYSSETMAINPAKIVEARILISEFREKLNAFLGQGDATEVYQICIQLFPLTNITVNSNSEEK